ncbi:MAG: hypothetical protein WCM76_12845 [Bacteroidota bacterium]
MKTTVKLVALMMFVVILLPSCKKYEEGPTISLRSKKARVVNIWKVDKVYINAVDVTANYALAHKDFALEFKDDGTLVQTYTDANSLPQSVTGTWALGSKNETLDLTYLGITLSHTILKLKNDELWLKIAFTTGGVTTTNEYHYITK